ncbi:putative chemoreceptor glutamine deamidase CheD [Limnobacter sp. 130]|jgi:chemotaxis protein CheD|uniref:chemoreceptor glutamine deamidase CheD n=1 Tax=Limnobacter sp. 130 TaxID=2653147 RepID=UPI0012EF2F4A|nr:chemoreceptor glutamine deamidase CheD [Limnobacter sp. 130]VWX36672.1 putative chemoreceptor glutamine deamidase CheD [Limnobacter sp. 130]
MSTGLLISPPVTTAPPLVKKIIMPGDYFVSWAPAEIATLLGSCVSACVWDSHRKIGGLNHFMLPDSPSEARTLADKTKSLRYGLYAMECLINDLLTMGAKREHLSAKVFGGANITGVLNTRHVGRRNAEFVIEFLRKDKIKVVASDLGGPHSRRIRFNTQTSAVRVERVASANSAALQQEKRYSEKINKDPVNGDIVFF